MTKKALLIGINYKNTSAQLNGCINDINDIKNILVDNCSYNEKNVRVLTDETKLQPTKKNIEDGIKWLVSNNLQGDTLFFYYSGHGSCVKDVSNDETDGCDEVLVPLDYVKSGVISDDWLFGNMVSKVPLKVTLWAFTDCCHSGTITDLKYNYKSQCALKKGKFLSSMCYLKDEWTDSFGLSVERSKDVVGNVCLFSGCLDAQTSADAYIGQRYQGAFTHCLKEFIKNNLVDVGDQIRFKSGTVNLRNMLKEINCRLSMYGFSGQNSQLSLSRMTDFERTFDP